MIFLSTVLACLLIGSGLSAVFIGSGMIVLERGWSMVISGSIVATGGVLLLGIIVVIRELRRLPDRIADVLPEALSSQLLYAAGEAAAHPEGTAETFSSLRPRIDHGAAAPWETTPDDGERLPAAATQSDVGRPPADFLDTNPLTDIYPMPEVSAPARAEIPAAGAEELPAPPVKIFPTESRKETGAGAAEKRPEIAPGIDEADRPIGTSGGKPSRSLWSRLGRGDKSVPESAGKTAPLTDKGLDAEPPPEPTTAELARQRLALADTPETEHPASGEAGRDTAADTSPGSEPAPESKAVAPPGQDATLADRDPAAAKTPPPDEPKGKLPSDKQPARPDDAEKSREDKSRPEPPAAKPADMDKEDTVPAEDEAAPAVVGSYRAGANLFIMYQNGTIEAETPTGIFRFASLDDLKTYIASGEDPALAGPRIDRPRTTTEPDATAPIGALPGR